MEIRHRQIKRKGEFYIDADGAPIAELSYFKSKPGEIRIYRTEVDESLRGQGIGHKLVAEAAKYARDNGLTIDATCGFAKAVLAGADEFSSLLV